MKRCQDCGEKLYRDDQNDWVCGRCADEADEPTGWLCDGCGERVSHGTSYEHHRAQKCPNPAV